MAKRIRTEGAIDEIEIEIDEIALAGPFESTQDIDEVSISESIADAEEQERLAETQKKDQTKQAVAIQGKQAFDSLSSSALKKALPNPVTQEEKANLDSLISQRKQSEDAVKTTNKFLLKLRETAESGLAGVFQGTLGVAESIYRTPEAVGRGLEFLDQITGGNLPLQLNELKDILGPEGVVTRGGSILGFEIGGASDIADAVNAAQALLPIVHPAFERNSRLAQEADAAMDDLIETGNPQKLFDTLLNPSAWTAFIGQAVPSLIMSWRAAGNLGFMAWLEGMESANDAVEFERQTGIAVTPREFSQAVLQAATIGSLLEKTGLDAILRPLKSGTKHLFLSAIRGGATEAITEGLQQLNQNLAKKMSFNAKAKLLAGIVPSVIGGFGAGAAGATISGAVGRQKQAETAKIDEIPLDAVQTAKVVEEKAQEVIKAREEAAKEVTEKIDEVEIKEEKKQPEKKKEAPKEKISPTPAKPVEKPETAQEKRVKQVVEIKEVTKNLSQDVAEISADVRRIETVTTPKITKDLIEITEKMNALRDAGKPVPSSLEKRFNVLKSTLEGLGPSEKGAPLKKKVIRLATGQIDISKKLTISEKSLLKSQLQSEQRAAKKSEVETKKRIKAIQKEAAKKVRETLPRNVRGDLISKIVSADTPQKLVKALNAVNAKADQVERAIIINKLKREFQRVSASKSISIEYVDKIKNFVDGINLKRTTSQRLLSLLEAQRIADQQRKEGIDVSIPQRIIDNFKILGRKPIDTIPTATLENIVSEMKALAELGKTKLRTRQALHEIQKENDLEALREGTVPIETRLKPQEKLREKFTGNESKVRAASQAALDAIQHVDLSITPMDAFFDRLDGEAGYTGPNYRIFKKQIDQDYSNYLDEKDPLNDQAWDLAEKLKLDEPNFLRIGIFAADQQVGGREKLINSGLTDQEIESVKLTKEENEWYLWSRNKLDSFFPKIQEYMRVVENRDFRQVKNYYSFMTDFEAMSDSEISETFGDTSIDFGGIKRKNVNKDFTKERKGPGKQKIKLDAMEVFLKHTDNVAYLLNVGASTKRLQEMASTEDYKNIAGDKGQEFVRDWLDLVARKGGGESGKRIAVLDALRRNAGMAVLTFKLSSALIQPTALLDGASVIGKYAFDGVSFITDENWRKFLVKNFPEIRNRVGDDPAFLEFAENKNLAKAQQIGIWALKKLDGLTASAITAGAYKRALDQKGAVLDFANPDAEAIAEAQRILRETQSSQFFKDVPLAVSKGKLSGNKSFDRALLQFQTFMLTRWSRIRRSVYSLSKGKNVAQGVNTLAWVLLANVGELGIRRMSKEAIAHLVAGVTGEEPDLEPFEDEYVEDAILTLLGNIPIVSNAVGVSVYGGQAFPSFDLPVKAAKGVVQAFRGTEDITKLKGTIRAILFTAGFAAGVPGVVQVDQLIRELIDQLT